MLGGARLGKWQAISRADLAVYAARQGMNWAAVGRVGMKAKVRAASEARRGRALCAALLLVAGCSSTVTTQAVSSPVAEQRTRVDASVPLVTSNWTLDGSQITGHVSWASCVSQRSWTIEQQRTVHRRPIPAAGWGLLAGGAVLGTVGIATAHYSPAQPACPSGTGPSLYGPSCGDPTPDNTAPEAELVTGLLAVALGLGVLAVGPSDQTTTLSSQPHAETATVPCISEPDLATLVLVLELGENKFLHVELQPNGDASIELPSAVRSSASASSLLRPGADLPIVVYRAPAAASAVLARWQVVGTVRVPE